MNFDEQHQAWTRIIVQAMADHTGNMDYDSDSDETSYSCPFCSVWWDSIRFQDWWDEETSQRHMAGRLEKHKPNCPVALAREILGRKPNADPVICPLCGKENWYNGEGWDGTENEFIKYSERENRGRRKERHIYSGCCLECSERYLRFIQNRNRRLQEERLLKAAALTPEQIQKLRDDAVRDTQIHYNRAGIKGKVIWDDYIGGIRLIQTEEELAHNRAEASKRVDKAIRKLKNENTGDEPQGS